MSKLSGGLMFSQLSVSEYGGRNSNINGQKPLLQSGREALSFINQSPASQEDTRTQTLFDILDRQLKSATQKKINIQRGKKYIMNEKYIAR